MLSKVEKHVNVSNIKNRVKCVNSKKSCNQHICLTPAPSRYSPNRFRTGLRAPTAHRLLNKKKTNKTHPKCLSGVAVYFERIVKWKLWSRVSSALLSEHVQSLPNILG